MPGRASVGPGTASEEPESVPGGIQWGLKAFGAESPSSMRLLTKNLK